MQLNFIANTSVPSSSGQTIAMLDPSDGQPYDEIQRSNAADIDSAVAAARQAFDVWSKLGAAVRGRLLMRLSLKISEHAEELTVIEQRDCGKPTKQAKADAAALVRYFEFYAGACDKLHGETLPYLDGYSVMTWREPHGVTGHIIPWNYPMQIFGRSVGGALAAGNVCVVKPAEDACLSLIRVAQLAAEHADVEHAVGHRPVHVEADEPDALGGRGLDHGRSLRAACQTSRVRSTRSSSGIASACGRTIACGTPASSCRS